MRTDIHRPSAIQPADYQFVAVEYDDVEDDIGGLMMLAENRRIIREHMERTGGHYSRHRHGGNCHVCGAHCIYSALFFHPETNTYIRTGFDCAEKMMECEPELFRAFRSAIHDARQNRAGRHKARAILDDSGLSRAWELYDADELPPGAVETVRHTVPICPECNHTGGHADGCSQPDREFRPVESEVPTWEYRTLRDIIHKLVRYGDIGEKQEAFLRKLVDKIDHREERERQEQERREAEHAAAAPCPRGRVTFTGRPVSVRRQVSQFGEAWKWLIITDDGWKTWGTIPSAVESQLWERGLIQRGHDYDDPPHINRDQAFSVTMTATVEPSRDDPKFGFYKRPAKAELTV